MTRLILIRHAKSSWDDPFGDDHARPLNKRGRQNAAAIGQWLRDRQYLPDHILCSDAARTRETEALLALDAPVTFDRALYHAAPETMLDLARSSAAASVALIGHNPGMAILAGLLVRNKPDHPRFDDYPTCAVTIIDFDTERAPAAGRCVAFITPRDLPTPT